MRLAYVDTSAIVALLCGEAEAFVVQQQLSACDAVYSANLLEAELRAFARREQLADGPVADAIAMLQWILPARSLAPEMQRVLACGYLRGADLWHVACALFVAAELCPPVLVTLDERQAEVAGAAGLEVAGR